MIGVVGGGAFGTALAMAYARRTPTVLWARNSQAVSEMNRTRVNERYLPDAKLPRAVTITDDAETLRVCEIILICVPTQKLRSLTTEIADILEGRSLVACCKGAELKTGMLPTQIVSSCVTDAKVSVLTGPSFACDIARNLPTALCCAGLEKAEVASLQHGLALPTLRIYRTRDLIGAQLGGALKNVVAIACGSAIGAGLGESARAALMTRGFSEMVEVACSRGARPETLMGLSGLGDLVLTCGSEQSRNFRLGISLGQDRPFDAAQTVEGAATAQAIASDPALEKMDLPIIRTVAEIVTGELQVRDAVGKLLSRPLKEE